MTLKINFCRAAPLVQGLHNALLFSSRDETVPPIFGVRFDFDGKQLAFLATDRYQASIEKIEHDPADSTTGAFRFTLPRDRAVQLHKALKDAHPASPIVMELDGEFVTFTVTWEGSKFIHQISNDEFPNIRVHFPKVEDTTAMSEIVFDPRRLANLIKVKTPTRATTIKIRLFGGTEDDNGRKTLKPALIEYPEGPRVLLMPMRETSAQG